MKITKHGIIKAPADRVIARDRFHRYATRSSQGREKWQLVALPLDGAECSTLGFNLVGQALDLHILSDLEYLKLKRLAGLKRSEMTTDEAVDIGELLAKIPRATVVDIDIDGDDSTSSRLIADRMVGTFADRGVELVAYHSSGPAGGGLHLAFGHAQIPCPDLGRMVGRLVAEVAVEAGLVAAKGSNVSFDGIALSWVLPEQADAAEPGAKLDLIPFNHDPSSRGRLFRPVGGLNKRETARKCIATWSRFKEATPIDQAFIDMIPAPRPAFKKTATPKKKYTFEKIRRARTHQRKDHQLTPLIDTLKSIYKPGDNHDIRLALSAIAISKDIMARDDWIHAIGVAFRDHEDAAAAWSSTATRLKLGQNCKGATWLRGRLGARKIWELARAVAEITNEKVSFVAIRFGRPYADKVALKAIGEIFERKKKEMVDAGVDDERRYKRLGQLHHRTEKSARCLQYQHKAECAGCDAETYTTRIRCDSLEVCPTCHSKFLMQIESWMHQNWRDHRRYHWTVYEGLDSKQAAQNLIESNMKNLNPHLKALRVCYPERDGTWSVFALSGEHELNNYLVGAAIFNDDDEFEYLPQPTRSATRITKKEAIRAMVDAISRRFLTIQELFELEEYELAADILETLYSSHRVTGTKDPTKWPTKAMLAEIVRDSVRKPEDELCECPFDMGEKHHYTHLPTGWSCSSRDLYPLSPKKLMARHQIDIDMGRAPPLVARSFFQVARRE